MEKIYGHDSEIMQGSSRLLQCTGICDFSFSVEYASWEMEAGTLLSLAAKSSHSIPLFTGRVDLGICYTQKSYDLSGCGEFFRLVIPMSIFTFVH